ncbi:MAG: sugar ABC transporter permease [Firmicutes bacterium]|nr:sugar ABC transporter permease [Bacillota bacterium]
MKETAITKDNRTTLMANKNSLFRRIWNYKALFLMLLPGLCFILLFNYGPMYGLQIAFKDYNIGEGIWGSSWVGLKHFKMFFSNASALRVLKNTLLISIYRLLWGFPAPIILALLINEVGNKAFKRVAQTISYLPHFISWVIAAGIVINVLSPSTGIINHFLKAIGIQPIYFMTDTRWFRTILVASGIWKEVGWGSVVYLAAISSIEIEQYDAAIVDGATRIQRMRYITIPSMLPLISIILILSMGGILNAGFDQIFNMYNPMVFEVSDIIDTYVYRIGLVQMNYSFSTAVGFFKSTVGLTLILIVQFITKQLGNSEYGLW